MKARPFFLIACTLILSLVASAQTQNNNLRRKPDKEPVTAKEWYEYARWSSRNEGGTPERAMQAVNKAIELQPNLSEALHLRGSLKMNAGDYKGALEDFNSVIQFKPDVADTYWLRAEARLRVNPKDINGALADYESLLNQLGARDDKHYVFVGRSKLRYQKGDLSGALNDIEQALAMEPDYSTTLFLRALIYLKQGNDTAALADLMSMDDKYQQLIAQLKLKHPELYSEYESYPYDQNPLASLKPKSQLGGGGGGGRPGGTVFTDINGNVIKDSSDRYTPKTLKEKLSPDAWFDPLDSSFRAFAGFNNELVWYYFLGELLEQKGEADKAEEAYTNAIIGSQENFLAHLNRGKIRLSDGRLEPAIRDLSWTVHFEPKLAEAYAERGLAILMLNHDALAQKDFDIYLKLEPAKKAELEKRIAAVKSKRKDAQHTVSP